MISAFTIKGKNEKKNLKKQRGQEETLGGDGKIYGLHINDGSWGYVYLQTHQVVYIKYLWLFVCQSYFNKSSLRKRKSAG